MTDLTEIERAIVAAAIAAYTTRGQAERLLAQERVNDAVRAHLAIAPPVMTPREGAILAVKVMDLLEEIDNTLKCLEVNGLEQHHADLHKRVDPVWRALDPILANGPECVERLPKDG